MTKADANLRMCNHVTDDGDVIDFFAKSTHIN